MHESLIFNKIEIVIYKNLTLTKEIWIFTC